MLTGMKQSSLDLNLSTKKTRKQELLAQMDRVVPWAALVEVIAPYYPEGKNGRPPFALETMLRIHCMQQWFTLSDLAMEEAFFDTPIYREFAGLDAHGRMPDESTILRFRHRLEKHRLAEQILATVNDLSWSSFFRHSDRGSSFKLSELQTPDASRSYWVTGIPAWSAA